MLSVGKRRVRVVRFNMGLLSEADRDLDTLGLQEALRRWQPQIVTIDESDAESLRAAAEHLMVAAMPRGRAAKFRTSICLALPPGAESKEPARVIAAMLQALLLSPKTGLLGSWALEADVKHRISAGKPFGYLYSDIDNFKAYNDVYGVKRGDDVIMMLAQEVERVLEEKGGPEDICAHIGGDDFAIVTTPDRMKSIADALINRFKGHAQTSTFYEPEHLQGEGIEVENRRGEKEKFHLRTITVAGVSTKRRKLPSYQRVCDIAAELKELGKRLGGNTYVEERRRDQQQEQQQDQRAPARTP
jgi:GGDEF domain-containing protein